MSRRAQRVASLIRETIGQVILTQLSDPRVDPARTSVTKVEVPEDLLSAKVGVSIIGSESEERTALRALNHAAGRIQELMMRKIRLRHTPQLRFEIDTKFKKSLETFELIEKAMREIREKEAANADEAPSESSEQGDEQDRDA